MNGQPYRSEENQPSFSFQTIDMQYIFTSIGSFNYTNLCMHKFDNIIKNKWMVTNEMLNKNSNVIQFGYDPMHNKVKISNHDFHFCFANDMSPIITSYTTLNKYQNVVY